MSGPWLSRAGAWLLAGTIGWAGVTRALAHRSGARAEERRAAAKRGRLAGSDPTAQDLLERVKTREALRVERKGGAGMAVLKVRFDELRKTVEPFPERGKAALAAWRGVPEGKSSEWLEANLEVLALAAVRTFQWMEEDPMATEEGLQGLPAWARESEAMRIAVEAWSGRASPDLLEKMVAVQAGKVTGYGPQQPSFFDGLKGNAFAREALAVLLRKTCEAGDVDALAARLKALPPEAGSAAGTIATEAWPREKLEDLMDLAIRRGDRKMLAEAGDRMTNEQYLREMAALRATEAGRGDAEDPNLTIRESLILRNDPGLTLEQRVTALTGGGDGGEANLGQISDRAREALMEAEAGRLQSSPRTGAMMDAFEDGMIPPEEAWRQLQAAMPDTTVLAPAEVGRRALVELMKVDPERALGLLMAQPEEERAADIKACSTEFFERYYSDVRMIDALRTWPRDGPDEEGRQEAWKSIVHEAYDRYGDFFIARMSALPEGADRDLGLSLLADEVVKLDPGKAAELRGWVKGGTEGAK